ncbi:hypothetical protein [Rugosimonospora acidiphila]|uniref:hypothetical protein n=1 Tax=Rugosimonospora acidiphila TaxID=556531 RepID=UPI0031EDEF19
MTRFDEYLVSQHTGKVESLSGDVAAVRRAVDLAMDPQAYGYLCRFLPALLESVFASALDTLDGEADALAETAANLRTATAILHDTDTRGGAVIAAVVSDPPA